MSIDDIWKQFDDFNSSQKVFQQETPFKCDCEIDSDDEQDIIELDDTLLCRHCGVILEDRLVSDKAEWRTFNDENGFNDNGNRCGQAVDPLAPISSMSCVISGNSKMAKMNLWLSLPYNERVIYQLKNKLNILIAIHSLPGYLTTTTLALYKKFTNITSINKQEMNLYRGKNKDGLLAVCFYYAAKFYNLNMTSAYICHIFSLDKKNFSKSYKMYNEFTTKNCDNRIYDIVDLADRHTTKLNLSFNIQKLCKNIIRASVSLNLMSGMSPQGVIAGVIYFINIEMNLNIPKQDISKICDISENTMIKSFKILDVNKNNLFNIIKQEKT